MFERFNFDCNLVNAMQRWFGLNRLTEKIGTHTCNMIKMGNYLKNVMKSNIDARIC